MPRCSHCAHELPLGDGHQCPDCGRDLRGTTTNEAVVGGQVPHSHGARSAADTSLVEPVAHARSRFVSTAGPSIPVLRQQDDSVPAGWMARLEAARNAAVAVSGAPAAPPPGPRAEPPPLPRSPSLSSKPAHLLLAYLEAENSKREAAHSEVLESENDELSRAAVVPAAAPRRRSVPDWAIFSLLGVLVLGGIAYAYARAHQAPAPKAEIDPKLAEAAEKKRAARAALEEGHQRMLDGPKGADAAIEAYGRALALEPTLASAERGMAIAHAAKNDDAAAVRHYARYLELDPDAKDAPEVRAIIARYERTRDGQGR